MLPVLAALLLATPALPYCPKPVRHASAVAAFERAHPKPATGAPYVVDHVVPLCACGADAPANMMWQRRDSSLAKDAIERDLCTALRRLAKYTPPRATGGA